MKIAIMQPYFFPYIGYFQLAHAVDRFIFYDDVNYITQGWINRNKILINNKAKYITIPCSNASQNKLIYEVEHALTEKKRSKLIKKIKFTYSNAPFFDDVFSLFQEVINTKAKTVAELAIKSIKESCSYLGLDITFKKSSETFDNKSLNAANRLIDICKKEGITNYINAVGGQKLYDKRYFKEQGVKLSFLESDKVEYQQFGDDFVTGLSMIDVMMFNSPEKIKSNLLESYELV